MFRPVNMLRLQVIVLQRDSRAVLRQLGRAGIIQLTHEVAGPETAPLTPCDRSAGAAGLEHFTLRAGNLRQSLELPPDEPEPLSILETSLEEVESELAQMEQKSAPTLTRHRQLRSRIDELKAIQEQLADYDALELPLDRPAESSFLHFVTGTLPVGNLDNLKLGAHVALLPLSQKNDRQLLVAITTRQNRPALEYSLHMAGFHPDNLPIIAGATTDTAMAENERELETLVAELKEVDSRRQQLGQQFAPALTRIKQFVDLENRLAEAEQNFPRTETVCLITGWMPAVDVPGWEEELLRITGGRCFITSIAPGKADEDQTPVLLRHPWWLRPFEMVVTAYGLPKYLELEPTLLVAVSYLLMFGIMFGDVGHGLLLAASGLIFRFTSRKKSIRNAALLLFCGGCSSIVFGVLYGSFFGLPQFKLHALWRDPLEGSPMGLLSVAIGIGIVMISLGLMLNVLNHFRRGDFIGGLLDKFGVAGIVFYWGAIILGVRLAVICAHGLLAPAIIVFLILPVIGWMLQQPVKRFLRCRAGDSNTTGHSVLFGIMESLVEVFEAGLSYFANTISFVRLAAYAMSHAALLVATFMIAAEVKQFAYGGWILSVLVIILGNLIALVLEGIVASVQALRLEYYEFFGKFFLGDGRPFKPFRLYPEENVNSLENFPRQMITSSN